MPGTFVIVQLVSLALGHVLAVPSLPPAPFGHGPLIPDGPITELNPFMRATDSQVRSRKTLHSPAPQWRDPMEEPTSHMTMRREPNEIEKARIDDYINHHPPGQAYVMDSNGLFSELRKASCTLKYYCGKVEVYDEEHHLLHETGCCFCPHARTTPQCNWAECGMTSGIIGFVAVPILSFIWWVHASD